MTEHIRPLSKIFLFFPNRPSPSSLYNRLPSSLPQVLIEWSEWILTLLLGGYHSFVSVPPHCHPTYSLLCGSVLVTLQVSRLGITSSGSFCLTLRLQTIPKAVFIATARCVSLSVTFIIKFFFSLTYFHLIPQDHIQFLWTLLRYVSCVWFNAFFNCYTNRFYPHPFHRITFNSCGPY